MTDVFGHPWLGGLFGDDEVSAVLAPDYQMRLMLDVERAYTGALQASGKITDAQATDVCAILANHDLDMGLLRQGTGQDGMIVPGLIRQLKAQLPKDQHAGLHSGLTSQDVIDTALALSLQDIIAIFIQRIHALDDAMQILVQKHGPKSLMGRTRMQAALPITVHDRINTWRMPLDAHAERLKSILPKVAILSIGGPVGTRPKDETARHMAKQLGLALPEKAPHTMRENLVDLANALALVTGTLGKMGQDICLMGQQGIDEVKLKQGGTSSAMAHKNNPIRAELLVTLARFNATQISGMHHTMIHEQERSGISWTLEWMLLPQMLQATGSALLSAQHVAGEIEDIGT